MRIAIIGASGTLGRHLVAQLRKLGHEVRQLSRNSGEYRVDVASGQGLAVSFAEAVAGLATTRQIKRSRTASMQPHR